MAKHEIGSLPSCHQISRVVKLVEGDTLGKWLGNMLLGKSKRIIYRYQGMTVWLQRTAEGEVFRCPVRVKGKCGKENDCIPRKKVRDLGIEVIDTDWIGPPYWVASGSDERDEK